MIKIQFIDNGDQGTLVEGKGRSLAEAQQAALVEYHRFMADMAIMNYQENSNKKEALLLLYGDIQEASRATIDMMMDHLLDLDYSITITQE